MKKEFKYPCAVETKNLSLTQGRKLQEALTKLGTQLEEYYTSTWRYYGVDAYNQAISYNTLNGYCDSFSEEATLYTYDEIMSFVAELEQHTEVPVTKRQLEFPCAIAMSEITSQEVYEKVFNAFIEAGAVECEAYHLAYIGCPHLYFGVDTDDETWHWDNLEGFDCLKGDIRNVTTYSLEDILGAVGNKEPSPYNFSLIGKEVYHPHLLETYLIEKVDLVNETITIGSDKDSGEIVCKLTDVTFVDQQEASSEPLGDVLADTPSVGIKDELEVAIEASEDYLEWGDWEVGDEVVFCGYVNDRHSHWEFVVGETYIIGRDGCGDIGPLIKNGNTSSRNYGFNFKKKLATVGAEVKGWPQLPATSPVEEYLSTLRAIQDSEDSTIGATADISITVNIKGSVFKLTREEAHKLSNDLYSIFEDEVV